jgi:restriction system protein
MTIIEAIKETMKLQDKPLTIQEIYTGIKEAGLYTFNAEKPLHIVASQIRRHCRGLSFPSASSTKHFESQGEGLYFYLNRPVKEKQSKESASTPKKSLLNDLKAAHKSYTADVRSRILGGLKKLHPDMFEQFAKKLLEAYGFIEVSVTQRSKDGGIDGNGRLKVGLAHINVAFQCKRYTNQAIGRPAIDQFRGAIQGQVEQGIFFTTSRFVPKAEDISFKPGAVPIILLDGEAIVDLMIEKRFGVEIEHMSVPSYALDMLFAEEDSSASSLQATKS